MTEQQPMTTQDPSTSLGASMPGAVTHKVRIGSREMTLTEARAGMNPALAHQLDQQYPRANETPELAQQLVDAYAAAHQRDHGEAWTVTGKATHDDKPRQHDQDKRKRD